MTPKVLKLRIGNIVRNERVNRNMSYRQLTLLSGVKFDCIHSIEKGEKSYTADSLLSILIALNIPSIDIV